MITQEILKYNEDRTERKYMSFNKELLEKYSEVAKKEGYKDFKHKLLADMVKAIHNHKK